MSHPVTEEIMQSLRDHMMNYGLGDDLEIPPKVFTHMAGEFIDYKPGKSLTARFPNLAEYQNPLQNMQGGFIVVAIDNTIGPFSYLLAPPSVTSQLHTTYIRPITKKDKYITVKAELIEKTKRQLIVQGKAFNDEGKLAALVNATQMVIS